MTTIEVRGLRFAYGPAVVLDDLDLTVPSGSLTALIGPSGCGKTTLLRVLAGFEWPSGGVVRLGDRVVAGPGERVRAHRRRVGVVPQEGALFPHLTVAQNIGYALRSASRAERSARVGELVELVELAGLERRHPRELSGGQQQRVAVARALAPRPDVVLLDEPFASLDATTRSGVREGVRGALLAEGATAVVVTHDRDEALSFADRIAVVRAGRIAQVDAPAQIYDAPVDADVARTLGPATLLDVTHDGGAEVSCAVGRLAVASRSGRASRVLLRPESVRATRSPDAAGGSSTATSAVVRAAAYQGASTHLQVQVPGAAHLLVAHTSDRGVRVGDRVHLRVEHGVHLLD